MAEVSFNSLGLLTFLLYLQIDQYFFLCYGNVIFFSKVLKVLKTNYTQNMLSSTKTNFLFFVFFLLAIFFNKSSTPAPMFLLTLSIFYFSLISNVLDKILSKTFSSSSLYLILPSFAIFSFCFLLVKSFLTLFFVIELYSVLYYFCFLSSYTFTNQTILKYKNGLLFLLWNNFLTSFFLGLGSFFMLRYFGTTDFLELSLITTSTIYIYIYILGLFWKLGVPLFHFFKLEVYKYLLKENVFLFSIITTSINIIILVFCLSQPIIFNTIYLHNFFLLVISFSIVLVLINLNLTNILQFFALSGVLTLSTFLSLFLL